MNQHTTGSYRSERDLLMAPSIIDGVECFVHSPEHWPAAYDADRWELGPEPADVPELPEGPDDDGSRLTLLDAVRAQRDAMRALRSPVGSLIAETLGNLMVEIEATRATTVEGFERVRAVLQGCPPDEQDLEEMDRAGWTTEADRYSGGVS